MAPAVELAYQRGARFDGWSECFDYDRWMQAFADTGIAPAFYANRTRDEKEVFPFEHLDPMISDAICGWKSNGLCKGSQHRIAERVVRGAD